LPIKPNKMNLFEKPIKDKVPFAVIRYNEWLIADKDNSEMAYEMIKIVKVVKEQFITDEKKVSVSYQTIQGNRLTERQIRYFKSIANKFDNVVKESYGSVWEINGFREVAKKLNIQY
jgi:hypothetical protein